MRRFVLIRENLRLDGKNWITDQKVHFDKILNRVNILHKLLVLDKKLIKRGILELENGDIKKIRRFLKVRVYDHIEDLPFFLPTEEVYDIFTNNEKDNIIASTNPHVKRFDRDLTIRPKFNVNNAMFINMMNRLETLSIIGTGRADEILSELKLIDLDDI